MAALPFSVFLYNSLNRRVCKEFSYQTGLPRDSARSQVHGFGRSQASRAVWNARRADAIAADLQFRKTKNTGIYEKFPERMSLQHVRRVVKDMEIDLKGSKITIVRDKSLVENSNFMGYTFPDGSCIQLYPMAFISREQLVKTLGHEYTHLCQAREHGIIQTMEELIRREREAYGSETTWWDTYRKKTGYRP